MGGRKAAVRERTERRERLKLNLVVERGNIQGTFREYTYVCGRSREEIRMKKVFTRPNRPNNRLRENSETYCNLLGGPGPARNKYVVYKYTAVVGKKREKVQ